MVLSFLAFLGLFVIIGISSVIKSRGTKQDYYLASSSIPPSLVGLSAVATNNSGYMFIGVIGYTYVTGLAAIWLMIGWILGDFLASTFVHERLRRATHETTEVSYAGVLSQWQGGGRYPALQRLIALISLAFLVAYASAQLVAGSKALMVLLEWPASAGAVMGAIMVALYCVAGGIRASIWTDVAQSIVMIVAMAALLVVATNSLGGISGAVDSMRGVDGFLDWFPRDMVVPGLAGGLIFAVGWMFAGFSVIGQPHIMVRFMTLSRSGKMHHARAWYYLWFTIFYAMATGVGMLARIYLTDSANFDAELALPTMAIELMHPVFVGLVLAGIFAATMSTADSLVLNCSAAVTHDLLPQRIENTLVLKSVTIAITLGALAWALVNKQSVFSLVILAWSGLASAFAPLLMVLCLGGKPSEKTAIIAVLTGLATVLLWRFVGWHNAVYEGMAGIIAGLLVLCVPMLFQRDPLRETA